MTNENEYALNDLTALGDAVKILVRSGINAVHGTMRTHIQNGKLKGQLVGQQYFVLTSEIERLKEEASDAD